MPETVGLLLLDAAGFTEFSISGGLGAAGATGVAVGTTTISLATIIGTTAIVGASIGLQYALNNPSVPRPENGAVPIKQAIPPRVRGYWINRLSGPYMLFVPGGGDSQDVIALHSGQIESILQVYLHDQPVSVLPAPTDGAICTVQQVGSDQFRTGAVRVQFFYGSNSQPWAGLLSPYIPATWTSAFHGNGIAYGVLYCIAASTPSDFTKVYPQGLPLLSAVIKCAPIWDPRDGTQSFANPLTWKASPNPVLQLINYLTESDGGMGLDLNEILPPATLAQWMVEASLCDGRYKSAGFYQFDNSPESVIGKILSTCDGWFAPNGDGTLALTVGVYREPTDPPITTDNILGFSVKYGTADEETVNQLDVTYTNPALGYVSDQLDSVRDEAAIALTGVVRAKPLDLSWAQDSFQANLLGQRAMLRLNPKMSGTLITTLYGMRYLGARWVALQFPTIPGLEDCIIEIQDNANIDILGGRVTFTWNIVDRAALIALGASQPTYVREDFSTYRREDNSVLVREH